MAVLSRPVGSDRPHEPVITAVVPPSTIARVFRSARFSADIWFPAGVFASIVLACFLWPLIYPVPSPINGNLLFANLPPLSPHHILGTDPIGNDVLSRILYGGRISIEVGIGSNILGLMAGGSLGIFAGFWGGLLDTVIMRVLDMLLAFPQLILALVFVAYLGAGELHVIWAIAFFSLPSYARLARAATLRVRHQNFVLAGTLAGQPSWRILTRHIAPNVIPQLSTYGCLGVAIAIIVEASLSFLGLGVPPPGPSWGNMIALGQNNLSADPYLVILPACFLFVTVISLNLLADSLRARIRS